MAYKDPTLPENIEAAKKSKREWYYKNKQKVIDRSKKVAKENRDWFREFKLSLRCEVCGENHPACLDFHHKDPTQKLFNLSHSQRVGYSKEKVMEEISKCSVLCSNCHRKLHYEESIKV